MGWERRQRNWGWTLVNLAGSCAASPASRCWSMSCTYLNLIWFRWWSCTARTMRGTRSLLSSASTLAGFSAPLKGRGRVFLEEVLVSFFWCFFCHFTFRWSCESNPEWHYGSEESCWRRPPSAGRNWGSSEEVLFLAFLFCFLIPRWNAGLSIVPHHLLLCLPSTGWLMEGRWENSKTCFCCCWKSIDALFLKIYWCTSFEVVGQSVLRLYRMEKGLPIVRSLMPEIPEVHFPNLMSRSLKKAFCWHNTILYFAELSGFLSVLWWDNCLSLLEHRPWPGPRLLAPWHASCHEGEHEGGGRGSEGTDTKYRLADVHRPRGWTGRTFCR